MKKITIMLLISLLSTNILFSMEEKNEAPLASLENADEAEVIAVHIESILDQSNSLDEMINLIAEDFKTSYLQSPQKNLYIKIFRKLAKQKFTSEFKPRGLDTEDLNNLSKPSAREIFIKTILIIEDFDLAVARRRYPIGIREEPIEIILLDFTSLLSLLVQQNEPILIKLLIVCGANINARSPITGSTLLDFALAASNIPMAILLIEFGADVNVEKYNPYIGINRNVEFTQIKKADQWGNWAKGGISL